MHDPTATATGPVLGVHIVGPLSLYAESDIITRHQLGATEGPRYSEMEREAPVLDGAGEPVLDADGEPLRAPTRHALPGSTRPRSPPRSTWA